MPDYKKLCAELLLFAEEAGEICTCEGLWPVKCDPNYALLDRARAALAEPELEGLMDEELMELLPQKMPDDPAEPEPEGPTDAELLCIAAKAIDGYGMSGIKPGEYESATECAIEVYGSELCAFARAVLARWGNHPGSPDSSLQPIPVSERPKPEDCDKEGTCWWWHPDHPESDYAGGWMQRPGQWGVVRYDSDDALVYTHWLPAHALPLPTHE